MNHLDETLPAMVDLATPEPEPELTKEDAMEFLTAMANDNACDAFIHHVFITVIDGCVEHYKKYYEDNAQELAELQPDEILSAHYSAGFLAGIHTGTREMVQAVMIANPELFKGK